MPDAPAAAPAPSGATTTGPQNAAPGITAPPNGAPPAVNGKQPVRGADGKFTAPAVPTTPGAKPNAITDAAKAAEAQWRYKDKLKVFGEEKEIDWGPEDIRRNAQKMLAADRDRQEAKRVQQGAQRLFDLAQSDPEAFLKELGKDPDKWAAERMAKLGARAIMTPEERAAAEAQSELEQLRAFKKSQEEAATTTKKQAEQARLRQENERKFIPALEKTGLPKTHETIALMAETALMGLNDGIEYTADELAVETERRVATYTTHLLGNFEGKALLKRLGPQLVAKVLDAAVADFNADQNFEREVAPTPERRAAAVSESAPVRYLSEAEARERLKGKL